MAVRLRSLAAGAAACATATLLIVLVPALRFAYSDTSLHVALETAATLIGAIVAFLMMGRFRRTALVDELLLAAGLSLLALSNLLFVLGPAVALDTSSTPAIWSALIASAAAALVIGVASVLRQRPLREDARRSVLAGIFGSVASMTLISAFFPRLIHLPRPETASASNTGAPELTGHPALLALQLLLAIVYALATYGFFRRHRTTGDELSGWLSLACLFATFARINYFLFPTLYSNWVYTGDVFRLVFYVILLLGAAREIASYWAGTVHAAHLDERRRVARDLHDGLAQEIAFVGRNARLLRERTSPELVERVIAGAERAYLESRRVVGALASPGDEPLDRALAEAAREVAARYGARLDLRVAAGITLPSAGREALVRIATEAVANAARHSGESDIRVELERLDRHTRLRVVDRGCGFTDEEVPPVGFGLISMRERTEAVGGQFSIRSGPGRGTVVEVLL